MNTTEQTTTDRLIALYALLDTPHQARARREIEEIMEEITRPDPHPQQAEEDRMKRLMAEIEAQEECGEDEADGYDPRDRF